LARFREEDRLALFFRLVLLRLALFRLALFRPPRDDLRVLFLAELRPLRLLDLPPRLADLRVLFLALLRLDFLLLRLAVLRLDFLRPPLRALARDDPPRELLVPPLRLLAGSSNANDGDELGVGEGVLSEGSGSIHPEPDQPISI